MKKYVIWPLTKYIWIALGVLFFVLSFYSKYTQVQALVLSTIGFICSLSGFLAKKAFYTTLSNGKLSKVTFFISKLVVDVSKITKLEIVWYFGYELRVRDDSKYQMLMMRLPNYHYHSKTLSRIIRDLKEIKPSIELDESCKDLLETGKWNLPKLYPWERWS